MQEVVVDCGSGQTAVCAMTDAQAQAWALLQSQAQAQAQAQARELAFGQLQQQALAGVSATLHGAGAQSDAAALHGLVAKLTAEPPQPLSAPEQGMLARFLLRCLLP